MPVVSHVSDVWFRVTDLEVASGRGCVITTTAGEQYLDFTSGIAVTPPVPVLTPTPAPVRLNHVSNVNVAAPSAGAVPKVTCCWVDELNWRALDPNFAEAAFTQVGVLTAVPLFCAAAGPKVTYWFDPLN